MFDVHVLNNGIDLTAPTRITHFAYWSRWPTPKRQALKSAARTEVLLEDFLDMINISSYIDVTLPALHDAHAQLVALNLITQAESDAILSTNIADGERP